VREEMTDLSAISANMGARTLRAGTNEHRRLIGTILSYALLAVFGLFFSFPLFWTASSSLQTWMELRSYTPHLLPAIPQWHNYIDVFTEIPFSRFLLNTLMIIVIAVPGELVTASMVAYGFGRFPFTGNKFLFLIMLGTMMIPTQVTLIPQYVLFFKLKLINTYVPLTIGSWLGGGAFNIFLMRQFIMSIPRELDEAATIDGAGPLRILWQVLIPLMKPALTTLGILSFLGHWNEFFAPFIYLSKMELFTAAVGLRFFKVEAEMGQQPRDHLLAAAAATMTFPVLLIFILAQRYFVSGIVLSGLKM
jgi:multiple sugar transport system permease protein